MAIVSIATLKTYFETRDVPTQAQFENLIDTLSNLATILGVSGDTGNAPFLSNDGLNSFQLDNNGITIQGPNGLSIVLTQDGFQFVPVAGTPSEFVGEFQLTSIPTSPVGLPAGRVWNDSGTLKIV